MVGRVITRMEGKRRKLVVSVVKRVAARKTRKKRVKEVVSCLVNCSAAGYSEGMFLPSLILT